MVVPSGQPARGEIWWVSYDPAIGYEQRGRRPALVVSANRFHQIQGQLAVVVPITRKARPYMFHLAVSPSETGLSAPSAIMCDQPRTISVQRFLNAAPVGRASADVMGRVDELLRALLELP